MCLYIMVFIKIRKVFCFELVFNAQLVPENTELITDIIFPETGDNQVFIPANAIIHQRTVEGMYICICLYNT